MHPVLLHLILRFYDEDATFEDPLMRAIGIKQIKSAFYSLPKAFKESKIVEYSIEEREVSPGKHEITIDNKQHYKFLGKDVDMISLIKLYIENGKVIRHEDWYNIQSFSSITCTCVLIMGSIISQEMVLFCMDGLCRWDKKPPRSRETEKIPMFGRVMEAMRRGTMLATHAMMGFGNDHEKNN
ncbi:hypothetical protein SAY86_009666 [Trapa natans]|uniref:Uncharacterized protein n=1 Tax=Trapa natans TaxID=22666 RepID=A0AAN7KX63_TRANT|nr:hypothetical protein SAY86_009666 [Trapa natans]